MLLVSPRTSQHRLFLIPVCLSILPCFVPAFQFTGLGKDGEQENCQHHKSLPIFSTGQAGHDPLAPWSTVCLISGLRWTGLDPSYPHASSLSMKHQKFSITPKSAKILRNLSLTSSEFVCRVLICLLSEWPEKKQYFLRCLKAGSLCLCFPFV